MPRIRSIKPSFFRSEDVSALPLRARLTWIGLWTHCDDEGRTKDNVRLIKGDIWPLDDVSLRDIEDDLETLAAHGRIVRYEVDGRRYLEIVNWHDHQAIQKATTSKLPAPPTNGSRTSTGVLQEAVDSATEGKGKEGKGKEGTRDARASEPPPATGPADPPGPEPPFRCPQHLDEPTPPPCGACADARRAHNQWEIARAARQAQAPRCPRHRGQLADNCAPCRAEQLAPPVPDPDPPPSVSVSDPPRAGPQPDEEVWMSAPRRGVDYHRIASPRRTGCGEPTTGGGRLTTTEAADFGTPCPRCWPPPTTNGDP